MNQPTDLAYTGLADLLNDCSIDRIMAIDKDWRIIAWNNTAEALSGISKQDILGEKLLAVFPAYAQDDEMLKAIDLAFSGFKSFVPFHKELFNRQHYENHFIPLRDTEGRLFGVMNIMHDVAHRIKAEQQLYQLNIALKKKYEQLERATDELATITYITSNNIKEPLRQVYSAIELLVRAEGRVMSDGGKANLRRTQAALNRMNLLLDDILALSGIHYPGEAGQMTDLNEVLQQASEKLAEKIKSNNVQVVAAALPTVIGYPELLNRLFFHLIDNAIRFRKHDEALTLTIDCQLADFSGAGAPTAAELAFTRISFLDNGTGFQQEEAEKIFLMVNTSTLKSMSSGAGLAICRKIMMAHDGYIQAEGKPGEGGAFHCYFPRTASQ
ncbi:ATP-binding protein [Paraflavitalea sp. CAU 1676]|uniref:sensor histidine kinase n=1 Tax=Paraflavitalea sp. CAU 1676 TaxID=3032598 RepID=UPI0023DA1AF6|nr:ATP-binding protein [Paraflavitalea sp. CAU 1676]MDF2191208.1 ATP-binding protein [Paraflavitalea sp. CAU 1676]